jgi:hypothetical protein
MNDYIGKFDNLGYDLLGLDNLVYLSNSADPDQTTDKCADHCVSCAVSCSTCGAGCSNGKS